MINFSRKFRKGSYSDGRISKYIMYAIGEILLVVIGILIALQVNNWNEERNKKQVSDTAIQNLKIELFETKRIIERAIKFNETTLSESEAFINDEIILDSLYQDPGKVFKWSGYYPLNLNVPIVQQEVGSGRLIFGKEKLHDALRNIAGNVESIQRSLFYSDEFWNNQVAPFYIKSRTMIHFQNNATGKEISFSDIEDLFNDMEYKNIISMSNLLMIPYIRDQQRMISSIDSTLLLIEEIN